MQNKRRDAAKYGNPASYWMTCMQLENKKKYLGM
jgi:hypothetical protein